MRPPVERKQHSPLPWHVVREACLGVSDELGVIGIAAADGLVVDDAFLPEADAEFIVEAVNASASLVEQRDALRDALTKCLPFIDDAEDVAQFFPDSAATTKCRAAVHDAKLALALVAERT